MADAATVNIIGNTNAPQGQIAAALAEFQKDIPIITKGSQAAIPTKSGGSYSYDYAALDALTPVILPLLAAQGIAYTAAPDWTDIGFGLRAALIHESGEKIEGFYPLGSPSLPAQAIGSAITYARRYALLSLTGVAPTGEDDDGASASSAQVTRNAEKAAAAEAPKETAISVRTEMSDLIDESKGLLTTDDANAVMTKAAPGKETKEWNLTDMKKGRKFLQDLLIERKAAAEAK